MALIDAERNRDGNSAAKASAKLYSIAALPSGRDLKGRFNVAGSVYSFVYSPASGEVTGRKLRLVGRFAVTDLAGRERIQDRIHAELAATQGGAGAGPPRRKIV